MANAFSTAYSRRPSARRLKTGQIQWKPTPNVSPQRKHAPWPSAPCFARGSSDVRRIAKVIERHGERFLDRIFTATERAKAENRANSVETYAKRFAAKEACSMALGTVLRAGVF